MADPTPAPTSNTDAAATQVIVLAFDLVGQQAANLPTLVEKTLSDKKVQDAIESTLEAFMLKNNTAVMTNTLTAKDAQDLLAAIASGAGSKAGDAALGQIKNSPSYKSLEKAIQDFQQAAKTTPMGVWLDKNQAVLYVTGVALVVGGAAALYATKTGGSVLNAVVGQIKNKPIQVFKVGKFTLQGQLLQFQPDKRQLGAGMIATEKWQQLQVSVGFGVVATGAQVQQVSGQVIVKSGNVSVTGSATDTIATKKVELHLTVDVNQGALSPFKLGVGAVITDGKATGGSVDGSYSTSAGDFGLKVTDDNKEVSGLATWTLHFR
ncbi:MAG: hypothetical protein WBE37_28240 [Bryobacteraceae bacterium]